MSSVKIILDNHNSEYFSGETISGQIECNFKNTKKIKAIRIKFVGRAETKWTESNSVRNPATNKSETVAVPQYAEETFMNAEYNLVEGNSGGVLTLGSGKHTYPFCHTLPLELPSSFEGKDGMIRYYIQTSVERPKKSTYETQLPLKIVLPLNLNATPTLRDPVALSDDKTTTSCCCTNSGALTLKLSVPVTGYIPGEEINIAATIQNTTKITAKYVKFKVVADYEYIVHHPKTNSKVHSVAIVKCTEHGVGPRSEKTWTSKLLLPTNYLYPNLTTCKIMNVTYTLKAAVILPRPNSNLELEFPITIGSIALSDGSTVIPDTSTVVDPNLSEYVPLDNSNVLYPEIPNDKLLPPPYSAHGEDFGSGPSPHSFGVNNTPPPGFIHSYPLPEKSGGSTPYDASAGASAPLPTPPANSTPYPLSTGGSAPYPIPPVESTPYNPSFGGSVPYPTPLVQSTPNPPSTGGSSIYPPLPLETTPPYAPSAGGSAPHPTLPVEPALYHPSSGGAAPYPTPSAESAPYSTPIIESASYPPLTGGSEKEELGISQDTITSALPPPYEQSQR